MRRITATAMLLALAMAAAACSGGDAGPTPTATPHPTASATQRPASTATLKILEPKEGQTITGTTMTVVVSLKGAKIVKPVSTNLVPDEGHVHVSLDGALLTMTASLRTVVPVTPGHHVVEVDFVANDHGPFDPPVVAVVSVDVKA